jgi:3D (Asp-Asp-Asp) domain-containing protein
MTLTNIILTAYCSCTLCCGKSDGITASGLRVRAGETAACNFLPFGTRVSISGVGVRTITDRMARRYTNRIDIYFPSHAEARRFGIRTNTITLQSYAKPHP